jgi:hypothetical protein
LPAVEFTAKPIGRVTCADCGWEHAEVRVNRAGLLWSHCDSCRSQHQTRTKKGSDALREHMHPLQVEKPKPAGEIEVTKPKAKAKSEPLPPRRTAKKTGQENDRRSEDRGGEDRRSNDRAPAGARKIDFWNDDIAGLDD